MDQKLTGSFYRRGNWTRMEILVQARRPHAVLPVAPTWALQRVNWNHCLFTVIIRHFIRNMCLLIKTTRSHLCLRQHFNPLHLWPRNLIGVRMPNQYLQPANLPKSDAKRRYIFTKDVVHITFIHMRRWNNETIQLLSYISNYFTGCETRRVNKSWRDWWVPRRRRFRKSFTVHRIQTQIPRWLRSGCSRHFHFVVFFFKV